MPLILKRMTRNILQRFFVALWVVFVWFGHNAFALKRVCTSVLPSDYAKDTPIEPEKNTIYIDEQGEVLNFRTQHSKTFYRGGKFHLRSCLYPLHFKTPDGAWEDIDMDIRNGKVTQGVYDAELMPDGYGYTIKHKDDTEGFTIRLKTLGGEEPVFKEPKIKGNEALWKQIVPGVDLLIRFHPHRVRIWRTLHTAESPKDIQWEVVEGKSRNKDKNIKLTEYIEGYDAEKNMVHSVRVTSDSVDLDERVSYTLNDEFTGQTIVMAKDTRRKNFTEDVMYPVAIDADIDVKINANANDGADSIQYNYASVTATAYSAKFAGFQNNNAWNTVRNFISTSSYASYTTTHIGSSTTTYTATSGFSVKWRQRKDAFSRFEGITIPQGATVSSATLKLYAFITSGSPPVRIHAKKLAAPVAPAAFGQAINAGTLATNTVSRVLTTAMDNQIIDFAVTPIVQELVDAFDYSNDAMLFFAKPRTVPGTNSSQVLFHDYRNGTSARFPNLLITYTTEANTNVVKLKTGVKLRGGGSYIFRTGG